MFGKGNAIRKVIVLTLLCVVLFPSSILAEGERIQEQEKPDKQEIKPPKCLSHRPEVMPKKYPFYMGHQAEILVETSRRILHRIQSEVFKIFLEEVLGFARVRITEIDDDFSIEPVLDRLSSTMGENVTFPTAMINLEVWVPPEYDTIKLEDQQMIKECGSVAPPGRFGWFIPEILDQPIREYYKVWRNDIHEVHWTYLTDPKRVKSFTIEDENWNVVQYYSFLNQTTKEYHCMETNICEKSMFIPEQCRDSNPCALLLAADYNTTSWVVDHIKELKLYVKVVWLGSNLKKVTDIITANYRMKSRKSLMILHWTPSEIILRDRDYISVAFPRCDVSNTTKVPGCKYELQRLVKFSWSKLEAVDKVLSSATRSFKFEEEDFEYLLRLFEKDPEADPREIGCQWMSQRESTWIEWKTDVDTTNIYIGGIFPISGSTYNGAGIIKGAYLASEAINANKSILTDYKIRLIVSNGRCRPDSVMKAFIDYIVDGYYNNLIGVLGPACSDTVEPLAGVSKHYRIMVISYSAEGSSFSDRHKYPFFFRTIGENKHYKHVYLQLFKKLGWTQVAALTEDGQKYTEYISHMQQMLEENGITFISNTKFPRERDTNQMSRYLENLRTKGARIIILDVFDEIARTVMCEAYRMHMSSSDGYVWFLPNWLNETWYDTDMYNEFKHENVNCTTTEMIKAVSGYFTMAHAFFAPNDSIIPENITVAQWKEKYKHVKYHGKELKGDSPYAGYAYDAVWVYAKALDQLVKTDPEAVFDLHSENTTNKLVNLIKNTDFYGVSGRIKFRGGPSRTSIINLMEWYDNRTHIIGQFFPNLTDDSPEILGGVLTVNMSAVRWFTPNGDIPQDGSPPPPVCGLDGIAKFFNVSCEMAIVILNVVLVGLLFLFGCGTVYMIKRRYEKKVQYTQKYMRHLGIDLLNPSNMNDLDKWEIPRNSVVINRKLGEGAFGTVYGGEANFPDKGWVAVAVKTLKIGSTTEEKLDFLSEAEVMKRFDHKNITQLLGVCTKEEPVYTIMEYMLYGDLKTFLLARRHLVNDKSIEESDEISSKKLTAMALDVSRALSYLAEMKYVHRDVASRNCLLNAQRVVKLGDFGMTRPMFENDYYKFTRKGMLPVRWMSPESLALGVFTPASDVWSYGVLLYEIITFGSFPYQGLTNSEVLDHVKAGNTIKVPEGVKPQLKCLLESCWERDPKKRIRCSEIAEFLANNPRLISPCLDVPLSSVQLEDTDQLEITLPDQFRQFSNNPSALMNNLKAATVPPPAPPTTPSIIPNGISAYCFDAKLQTLREQHGSSADSSSNSGGGNVNVGPKEPLLGPVKSSSSLLNFGKYVSIQHNDINGCIRGGGSGSPAIVHHHHHQSGDDYDDDDGYLEHNPAGSFNLTSV